MSFRSDHGDNIFDDNHIHQQSFARITQTVIQNGYADGVADGRETLYQKDFDRGYNTAFAMAFKLAQHQGFAAGGGQKQSDRDTVAAIQSDLILKKEPARAHCLMCTDKTLESKPLAEIITAQQTHNETVLGKLKERYDIIGE